MCVCGLERCETEVSFLFFILFCYRFVDAFIHTININPRTYFD